MKLKGGLKILKNCLVIPHNISQYYRPNRKYSLYNPDSTELFRLSRSKIDLFINCPRCFYLDRKLGVAQPPGYPFSLNSAVNKLL